MKPMKNPMVKNLFYEHYSIWINSKGEYLCKALCKSKLKLTDHASFSAGFSASPCFDVR